ncbi:hypothetical protein QYN14_25635 [Rhodococcus ruber]|uniref:hypothetical protein n=1 Tax=Rhodococcus ruber TaxID=1830 RepID=UPI0026596DBE|nr:hypothetical protein [Rhodococcus ruber]WKK11931.1 hypothetical protein QYN14_25215 [Rhodococcus ruber]WKK12015.1 hypothetical protein QYN14_25635 [Rhodococcus ruber]
MARIGALLARHRELFPRINRPDCPEELRAEFQSVCVQLWDAGHVFPPGPGDEPEDYRTDPTIDHIWRTR